MRLRALAMICCVFASISALSQEVSRNLQVFVKVNARTFALSGVRVIDGTGAPAKEDQTILISGGKIESVGDTATTKLTKEILVLDLPGYSVIPGLVGMHDHMFYPVGNGIFGEMANSFPPLYLAGGVTTIRTGGAIEPYTDLEVKMRIDAGESPGPKMHVTGPYLEGAGSWAVQMHTLSGPEDATQTVNFWLDQGVDNFKAYMYITPVELSSSVIAAHKRGAKITGHLCSIGFREAAALGIDNLEHGLLVDTEFFPWKKPNVCPDTPQDTEFLSHLDLQSAPMQEMIIDLVRHRVAITSTLPVFEMNVAGRPVIRQCVLDALSLQARVGFLNNKSRTAEAAWIRGHFGQEESPVLAAFKKEMEFEQAFVRAGGQLLAGLDPTGIGGVVPGYGDQREVELLVEAGFSPVEAIHIATENGAQFLNEATRIGTIAPGKQADLVLIKGDPSRNIVDIENVETVFKDGVGYDPLRLSESVRGMVGIR